MKIKYGMHYIYWQKDLDARNYITHVQRAAKAGFDAMEMGDDILFSLEGKELEALKAVKDDLKMELSLGLDPPSFGEFTSAEKEQREAGITYYQKLFPKLEYLGVCTLGGRLLYTSSHKPCVGVQKADIERGKEALAVLAKSAADYGITLNIEVCNRYECHIVNTAKQGAEFLKDLNEKNVKLLLDTYHMNIEEESFADAILAAGDYLGHVHAIENNRRLPGRGHLPWNEIGDALRRIDYHGMMTMEPLVQTGGQLADFCKIWRDMTDGADLDGLDAHAKEALQFLKYIMERK